MIALCMYTEDFEVPNHVYIYDTSDNEETCDIVLCAVKRGQCQQRNILFIKHKMSKWPAVVRTKL